MVGFAEESKRTRKGKPRDPGHSRWQGPPESHPLEGPAGEALADGWTSCGALKHPGSGRRARSQQGTGLSRAPFTNVPSYLPHFQSLDCSPCPGDNTIPQTG